MNNNTVSITIFVDTDKLTTIDDIEKAVEYKTRDAAKELMKQIFEAKEQKILKEAKLNKKQKVQRYLYTIFGPVNDTSKQMFKKIYKYIQDKDYLKGKTPDFPTFEAGYRELVLCENIVKSSKDDR